VTKPSEASTTSRPGTGEKKKQERTLRYLRIAPNQTDEWVESACDATPEYIQAAKVTLESLKRIGLKVKLLESPVASHTNPRFIICKEE
jgi:hypothetical protein